MSWIRNVRMVALGLTSICAIVMISISASLISITEKSQNGSMYYPYAALGLATGLLTIITSPAMIVMSIYRDGSFLTTIIMEVVWLTVLWVLWLATGALTVTKLNKFGITSCPTKITVNTGVDRTPVTVNLPSDVVTLCQETRAIAAFGFIVWIILFLYTTTLLIMSLLRMKHVDKIWTSSVNDGSLSSSMPGNLKGSKSNPATMDF